MISNKELIPFNYFLHTNYFSALMVGIEGLILRCGPTSHMLNILTGKTSPYRSRNGSVLVKNLRNGVCIRERGNPLEEIMALPWMGKDPDRR